MASRLPDKVDGLSVEELRFATRAGFKDAQALGWSVHHHLFHRPPPVHYVCALKWHGGHVWHVHCIGTEIAHNSMR